MPLDSDIREANAPTQEPEITSALDLCLADGRLNPRAVGWSRRPLHRCNLRGRSLRKKRWNHWAVSDGRRLLIVTLADVDYLGFASVMLRNLETHAEFEHLVPTPGAIGFRHADVVDAKAAFAMGSTRVEMVPRAGATELHVVAGSLEAHLTIDEPAGHESMNVVIPWDERTFQFTSKHAARPVRGTVSLDGTVYRFGDDRPAFACLDFGRGVWPYRTRWHWAAGSTHEDGHSLGINLGGLWTDGTGMTENAFWVDGRVHKISERVRFDFDVRSPRTPWRIHTERGDRVDLRFDPSGDKVVRLQLGVVATQLHVHFGRFSGTLVTDKGTRIPVRALDGWAEDHHARW